jgi:hypothetical protein
MRLKMGKIFEQIPKVYRQQKSTRKDAQHYYPFGRWKSIPKRETHP